MEIQDEYPGIVEPPVTFPCTRPYCDEEMLLHIASIHPDPAGGGYTVAVAHKCLDRGCGNVDKAQPVISEEERQHLLSLWDRRKELFWTNEQFIQEHTPDDMVEEVEQRLEDLGYM